MAEAHRRIDAYDAHYHQALAQLLEAAHARFGTVYQFNLTLPHLQADPMHLLMAVANWGPTTLHSA